MIHRGGLGGWQSGGGPDGCSSSGGGSGGRSSLGGDQPGCSCSDIKINDMIYQNMILILKTEFFIKNQIYVFI